MNVRQTESPRPGMAETAVEQKLVSPVELRDRIAEVAGRLINARINQPTTELQPLVPELRFKVLSLPHENNPILSGNVLLVNQAPPLTVRNLARYAIAVGQTKLGITRQPFRQIGTELLHNEQTLQALYDFLKTTETDAVLVVLEPNVDEIPWQDSEIVSLTKTVGQAVSSPV